MRLIADDTRWFLEFEYGMEFYQEQKSIPSNSSIKFITWTKEDQIIRNFKTYETYGEMLMCENKCYYDIELNFYGEKI